LSSIQVDQDLATEQKGTAYTADPNFTALVFSPPSGHDHLEKIGMIKIKRAFPLLAETPLLDYSG